MRKNSQIVNIRKEIVVKRIRERSKTGTVLKSKKGQTVEPLNKEEIKRIFDFFEKEGNVKVFTIIKLALNTGLRISDVLLLTFEEVESGRIKEKKTRKYKKIVFNEACQNAIKTLKKYYRKNHIENYNKGYLFKSFNDVEKPVSYQTFNYHIKKVREKLKIKHPFHSHSFRKTWARAIYDKNKNVALVMELLNHSNPAITLEYIGITLEEIISAYTAVSF